MTRPKDSKSKGISVRYTVTKDLVRKGDINFILTSNQDFFESFKRATKIAKRLNLLQKSDRIALFQRILYDNKNYKL